MTKSFKFAPSLATNPQPLINQREGGNQATASRKKKRRMSAEARRKISEAMKRRYAELRQIAKK